MHNPLYNVHGATITSCIKLLDPYNEISGPNRAEAVPLCGITLGVVISHSSGSLLVKVTSARVRGPNRADLSLVLAFQFV